MAAAEGAGPRRDDERRGSCASIPTPTRRSCSPPGRTTCGAGRIPRADYPDGRSGYLRWRTALKKRHAEDVARDPRRRGLRRRDDRTGAGRSSARRASAATPRCRSTRTRSAWCSSQTQFDELIERLGHDKAVEVVAKTLAKMSEAGREVALGLPLSESGLAVVTGALSVGLRSTAYAGEPPTPSGEAPMLCSSCGAVNPSGSRFCMSCGTSLETTSEPISAPAPEPEPASSPRAARAGRARPRRPTGAG